MSYLRSVYLHKDKSIFKVEELPIERYAEALGLPGMPKIKFLSKAATKQKKNASHVSGQTATEAEAETASEDEGDSSEHSSSGEEQSEPQGVDAKVFGYYPSSSRIALILWMPGLARAYKIRPNV